MFLLRRCKVKHFILICKKKKKYFLFFFLLRFQNLDKNVCINYAMQIYNFFFNLQIKIKDFLTFILHLVNLGRFKERCD